MIASVAAASRAEYPIKRDMGSPSVDRSVRPGYVASMRAAAVHAVGPGTRSTATIALVMKHVLIEERLPSSDDAVRGAHCRHEAGASRCSLVRASHLGELTFPSASQSAGATRSSARSRARPAPPVGRWLLRGAVKESRPGEADRALAAAQRAGDLPNYMLEFVDWLRTSDFQIERLRRRCAVLVMPARLRALPPGRPRRRYGSVGARYRVAPGPSPQLHDGSCLLSTKRKQDG